MRVAMRAEELRARKTSDAAVAEFEVHLHAELDDKVTAGRAPPPLRIPLAVPRTFLGALCLFAMSGCKAVLDGLNLDVPDPPSTMFSYKVNCFCRFEPPIIMVVV